MLKAAIEKLMRGEHLDKAHCQSVLHAMLAEETNPLHIASFLVLLRAKPETAEELFYFIAPLKEKMVPINTTHRVLDIVGTGGDGADTINISTASAILAASCGIKVAKHGNRAATSRTGSADVVCALGINIQQSPEKIAQGIDELGIGFCYAPHFHPTLQKLRVLRQQLNMATTFNLLGPFLNPANPAHYVMGVFNHNLLPVFATTLQKLATTRSVITHSAGLDEISCLGPSQLIEVTAHDMYKTMITPEQFGLSRCRLSDLRGGDANTNAEIIKLTFAGNAKYRAIAETLILNASCALYIYGQCNTIAEGVKLAQEQLYSGATLKLLNQWIAFSHD